MVSFFRSKKQEEKRVRSWYEDRIGVVTLQRNFLILFVVGVLFALSFSLFTLFAVTKSRSIEPFVIEVSKKTGVATLVSPVTVKEYSANRALTNNFLLQYLRARELFSPAAYQYNYYTLVRVFSNADVYSAFRYFLRLSNPNSPLNLYGDVIGSTFSVRSVQYFGEESAQIRFTIEFINKDSRIIKINKIATVGFKYALLEMSEADRYVNPLGFVVSSYQVDDDYT